MTESSIEDPSKAPILEKEQQMPTNHTPLFKTPISRRRFMEYVSNFFTYLAIQDPTRLLAKYPKGPDSKTSTTLETHQPNEREMRIKDAIRVLRWYRLSRRLFYDDYPSCVNL